jgi:hypothetical protein
MSLDFDYHELSGELNAHGDWSDYWISDWSGLYTLMKVTGTPAGADEVPIGQFVSIIDAITAANKDNDA